MQGLHPRTQQKSRRLKEEPHMHRQRKHRTYGVSAVCRKSAGIEKHTGSDSARSIRIPNVEEAAVTEQLGETEPGKSALSFTAPAVKPWMKHRCKNTKITVTGTAATMEAAIMSPPVRRRLAEERHHKNGGQRHRIEQVVPEPYRHCVRKHGKSLCGEA